MFIKLPEEVKSVLDILQNNNFDAYVVGGCVRDSIIGVEPKDWDITTSASPTDIISCFKDYRVIETGIKHGTVTVLINSIPLEITTYRIDGEYKDNRRPETVKFTNNIALDLERRDFTINAMAYNSDGLIDIYGGVKDINLKQVKCVGDPDKRFNEDGLRILRALRFASVLNYTIEENASISIHRNKYLLRNISSERIISEFNKLICGDNFFQIMSEYKDVFEVFIEEISSIDHDEWINILNYISLLPKDLLLRLALVFCRLKDGKNILKDLKYDNNTINTVTILCNNIHVKINSNFPDIKILLNKIGYDNFKRLLIIKKAIEKYDYLTAAEDIARKIIEENQCYRLKDLKINGQDLIDIGYKKGKLVGNILDELLNKVIDGELENDKTILIEYIKNIKII